MRFSYRTIFKIALLAAATVVAGARLAHGQAPVNPTAIEFTSLDHAQVNAYQVCVYPNATSTTVIRCNTVPVTQAVQVSGTGVYRLPRATWQAEMPTGVDLYPRVRTVHGDNVLGAEVAPTVAPFTFRLQPPPRPVTNVILVP